MKHGMPENQIGKKIKSLNKKSIGVEISNKGHQFGYQNFSKNKLNLNKLSKFLIKKYKIKKSNILGIQIYHYDRKNDQVKNFLAVFV